jgi:hypothetical protein
MCLDARFEVPIVAPEACKHAYQVAADRKRKGKKREEEKEKKGK